MSQLVVSGKKAFNFGLSWSDIKALNECLIITLEEIKNYCAEFLNKKEGTNLEDEETLINFLNEKDEIECRELIKNFFSKLGEDQVQMDKMIFFVVSQIKEKNLKEKESYELLTNLYSDLGYPRDLSIFTPYMPLISEAWRRATEGKDLSYKINKYIQLKKEEIKTGVPFYEIDWI